MPSVKLSVTVRARLERKYQPADLKRIDAAVKAWIAADAARGIKTVHVAVDDPVAMKAQGVPAVTGRATASKVKRAVDKLWARLAPDYLVIFGAEDVVPYFAVDNPSYDASGAGDTDTVVPTDNPYACSQPFRKSKRVSYLVPDRVVGRIPDAPGDGDPAWLLGYLATATGWASQAAKAYQGAYTICCDSWKAAGAQCVQYIGEPASQLMISPPEDDTTALPYSRLRSRLHMIKCHGAPLDPSFYGQKGNAFPASLSSKRLRSRVKAGTVVGAMCCYGAQVFSPADPALPPGQPWSIANTYLRAGAYGFAGSTMIAWVGPQQMTCADSIVAVHLRRILSGASLGRAFLESKQDYFRAIEQQGDTPGMEDEKTLVEFVLLGDPSIHPVASVPALPATRGATAVAAVAAGMQARRQRRLVRARIADDLRASLPSRREADGAARKKAAPLLKIAKLLMTKASKFRFARGKVRVFRTETKFKPERLVAAGFARAHARSAEARLSRESLQYYWAGRHVVDGHTQIRLVRVDTDKKGSVLDTRVVESS